VRVPIIEELFQRIAMTLALLVEGAGVVIVGFGAAQAFVGSLGSLMADAPAMPRRKRVWTSFAMWLLLGLEFELAADIIRSAVAPTWNDIGQLAAIAVIRTLLNYFLAHDIEEATRGAEAAPS
jgi:uncharacterized membrane protein